MKIAVVGSKERCSEEDRVLVESLIEQVAQRNFDAVFICTDSWNRGIGEFVRKKCVEKVQGEFIYQVILVDLRTYWKHRSRDEVAQVYRARNASLYEMADMLYYFAGSERKSAIDDLVTRMQESGRPVKVFYPGDPISLL
jgi:hypothetical protein